jgi:sulfur-oxidizing protein SoxY
MIDAQRRILLKGSLAAGTVGVAVGAGLLSPSLVLASWNESAFHAKELPAALNSLMGSDATETNDGIKIKAPDIAENGAVVPVTVETDMEGVKSIAIVAEGTRRPSSPRSTWPSPRFPSSRPGSRWQRPPTSLPWFRLPTSSTATPRK